MESKTILATVSLTPLTYTEFGQVLDAKESRQAMTVYRIMDKLKHKEETYDNTLSSLPFSLEASWKKDGVSWVRFDALNGYYLVLSHLDDQVTEFDLPDDLKEHIAQKKPVMVTLAL
ncbi:hypothetical protein [Streptococcus cuniculipharyngis]|uniref:Uncharacterized protein n=1 Tax=Streptococcus cuniculipharyngis TaxID=1562651 RepID=A0A5C5SBU1_9STRE|nr:hypothetical protein [Streptococcus cuniculipharyngis]TWS96894.1 hypothetical protein FRX57_06355 [Streptococcus cuniculipharyngis]